MPFGPLDYDLADRDDQAKLAAWAVAHAPTIRLLFACLHYVATRNGKHFSVWAYIQCTPLKAYPDWSTKGKRPKPRPEPDGLGLVDLRARLHRDGVPCRGNTTRLVIGSHPGRLALLKYMEKGAEVCERLDAFRAWEDCVRNPSECSLGRFRAANKAEPGLLLQDYAYREIHSPRFQRYQSQRHPSKVAIRNTVEAERRRARAESLLDGP